MNEYAVMPLADYVNSCEKIREKTDTTENIKSGEMPGKIDEVYEAGKKAEYGAWWDTVQNFGARVDYRCAFSYWIADYIRPNYKVIPTDASSRNSTFYRFNYRTDKTVKIEKDYFDFSQCPRGTTGSQGWHYTFSAGRITEIEDIGLCNAFNFMNTFAYCSILHTIECIYPDKDTLFSGAFIDCNNLINLTVNGTIGQNGFNVQWSTKLSHDSIVSIINALSATTTGLTVTLSLTAVNKAFETFEGANDGSTSDEWLALVATRSNWTIALA